MTMPVKVRQSDGVFMSELVKMIWAMSASLPTFFKEEVKMF
jgi:hypothetical protein